MHEIAQKQDPLSLACRISFCTRACLELELEPPFANYPFGTFAPSSHSHSHSDAIKNEAKRDDD